MICLSPLSLRATPHPVPCGRCYACIQNNRKQWTFRLDIEAFYSDASYFVTLTYNDEHTDGNVYKRDIQLWLKKYRKLVKGKFKYYVVSEYGSKTYRPHYHAHLFFRFNYSKLDLCKHLEQTWLYGQFHIGDTTRGSAHYTTKNHLTKFSVPCGLNPTFTLMSKRPAIGSDYIEKRGSFHKSIDNSYVNNNGFKQAMPRYYKDKLYSKFQKQQIAARIRKEAKELVDFKTWKFEHPNSDVHEYFKYLNMVKQSLEDKRIRESKKQEKL